MLRHVNILRATFRGSERIRKRCLRVGGGLRRVAREDPFSPPFSPSPTPLPTSLKTIEIHTNKYVTNKTRTKQAMQITKSGDSFPQNALSTKQNIAQIRITADQG